MAFESKWWNMRSGELVNSSTISRESSDSVSKFFGRRDWKSREIYLAIVCFVATGFGIGGIISLMMKHWMEMSQGVRLVVAVLPMLAGYFVFYKTFNNRSDSKFLMEAACVFCMSMIGFSLMLLTDYFPSLGEPKLIVFWMFLSLPVIYMSGSSFGAIFYLILVYGWLAIKTPAVMAALSFYLDGDFRALINPDIFSKADGAVWGWFFILLILPHFFDHFDRPSFNTRKMVLGFVGTYLLMYAAQAMFIDHSLFGMLFLMVCIYMLGKDYCSDGAFWWNRPMQTLVILSTVTIALLCTVKETSYGLLMIQGYGENGFETTNGWMSKIVNYLVLIGLAAGATVSVLNDMKADKKANIYIVMFPLVMLVGLILTKLMESEVSSLPSWLFTIYAVLMGVDYLKKGMENKSYGATALGVVILLIIANMKFYTHLKDMTDTPDGMLTLTGLFNICIALALVYFSLQFYKKTSEE